MKCCAIDRVPLWPSAALVQSVSRVQCRKPTLSYSHCVHWLQDKKSPFAYREEITLQNDDLTTLVWALDTTEIAKEATKAFLPSVDHLLLTV